MMQARLVSCLTLSLVGLACSADASENAPVPKAEPPPKATPPATDAAPKLEVPEVTVHGSVHEEMMMGETASKVGVDEVLASPHTYALGAISELAGEITVVDSAPWLAYPEGETTRLSRDAKDVGAALLVSAAVPAWQSVEVGADTRLDELGALVADSARAAGWAGKGALPFKITGPVKSLGWHVIDGSRIEPGAQGHEAHKEAAVRGELSTDQATLVGFYSTEHAGVFTHMGSTVHLHVTDEPSQLSAHVDELVVSAGATLHLPSSG